MTEKYIAKKQDKNPQEQLKKEEIGNLPKKNSE